MAAGFCRSRSGRADRLPLDHVHDPDQDDGPEQRDDERDHQAGRLGPEEDREDKPAQERPDDAEHDVPDDPVAVPAHDLAGEPAYDGPHDEKPNEMHPATSRLIWCSPRGESQSVNPGGPPT